MKLCRAGFFDVAAFYGDTALRIFYSLDRFSEDIDFSLLKKSENFDIRPYCAGIGKALESNPLNIHHLEERIKQTAHLKQYEKLTPQVLSKILKDKCLSAEDLAPAIDDFKLLRQ